MQRIQYHCYGGPEVMRLEEVDTPIPGPGQVRVRIRAAAANPADYKVGSGALRLVSGSRFPRGMGHDFAGVIEAVGRDVATHRVGEEVFGISGIRSAGAFADCLVMPEAEAHAKPPSVPFEAAAALPMASVTAWSAVIDRAQVHAGQAVFVTGCLGGLGRAGVQLALMRGAEVWGNCSAAGLTEARAMGVTDPADYREFDIAAYRGRFDLVFDTAGALSVGQAASLLTPRGVAAHAVFNPGKIAATLLSGRHVIASGRPTAQRMAAIAEAAERGLLAPKVGRIVPLSEAIPALVEFETCGLPKGKLVIAPS